MNIKSKKTRIISHVGANDIYSFDKNERDPETVIAQFKSLTDTLKEKTDNAVIIGILPRKIENWYYLEQAKKINNKVKIMCEAKGIKYLDFWYKFTDRSLFARDGIHLNNLDETKVPSALKVPENNEIKKTTGSGGVHVSIPTKASTPEAQRPQTPATPISPTPATQRLQSGNSEHRILRSQI
ncbi:unnamed protein product [Rotaria socialis]|uniref:SGNH hydrolase-type esterase domain-containing protein n=1 Tax=Rotaria socialis TaxID=392032 RepID=A0A818SFD3_9BILA|nr:unnamed protein product [Rotaria socialis]